MLQGHGLIENEIKWSDLCFYVDDPRVGKYISLPILLPILQNQSGAFAMKLFTVVIIIS
jgi:hypothetical protein